MIDMQHIFDILIAIIIATFGWLGKAMHADIKQNTKICLNIKHMLQRIILKGFY